MSDYPAKQPSLVLVPPVALMQWLSEIESYTDGTLKTLVMHGSNKAAKVKTAKELKKYDVILMSYNSLESMYRRQEKGYARKDGLYKEKSLIHSIHFHRVILVSVDSPLSHWVLGTNEGTGRGSLHQDSHHHDCQGYFCPERRLPLVPDRHSAAEPHWRVLQSNPLLEHRTVCLVHVQVMSLRDAGVAHGRTPQMYWLQAQRHATLQRLQPGKLFAFSDIGLKALTDAHVKQEILNPIQRYGKTGPGKEAFRKLRLMTDRIMLRRLKKDHTDSMELPVKEIYVNRQFFGEAENDFANSIMTNGQRNFDTYVAQGVLLNNYANIFGLIMQMRQVADHPDLILKKNAAQGQNVLQVSSDPLLLANRPSDWHEILTEPCSASSATSRPKTQCDRDAITTSAGLVQRPT